MGGRGQISRAFGVGQQNSSEIKSVSSAINALLKNASADVNEAVGEAGRRKGMRAAAFMANPNYPDEPEYTKNCVKSAIAYELLRRGYDVEALGYLGEGDPTVSVRALSAVFDGFRLKMLRGNDMASALTKEIMSQEEGSRFLIAVTTSTLGHVFSAERDGSGVVFIDPQTHKTIDLEAFITYYGVADIQYARLDDKTFGGAISNYVRRRK